MNSFSWWTRGDLDGFFGLFVDNLIQLILITVLCTGLLGLIAVILPMGLFNLIGSLQNLESAEAAGDIYPVKSSLAANGIGTIAAACFGSCFPTTIYIGHPAWKAMGASAGYLVANGVAMTLLCCLGMVAFAAALIPVEAGAAILLWIGVIIAAQAFRDTPPHHAPAVVVGVETLAARFPITGRSRWSAALSSPRCCWPL